MKSQGFELIRNERARQVEVGYTLEADQDTGKEGKLVAAGNAYLNNDPSLWPFSRKSFKPKSKKEDLIRAGALFWAHYNVIEGHASPSEKLEVIARVKDIAKRIDSLVTVKSD